MRSRFETVNAAFPNEPESVWIARRWSRQAVADWAPNEVRERIETILDELMSNAVVHGEGEIEVGLVRTADQIEISVADAGVWQVHSERDVVGRGSGRGLSIVDALATTWGVQTFGDGKGTRVWANVALEVDEE